MAKAKTKKSGHSFLKRLSKFSERAKDASIDHIQENLIERVDHAKDVRLFILEWFLLVFAVIMLAITQAFWYVESYETSAYVSGGTYTEATLGKVNSLNPLYANTSSEKTLSKLLFATLASVDYSGHMGLELASSITANETGTAWSVKLKENAKWSDGELITNEDVLYTVGVIQASNSNTNYSSNLANVKVSESEDGLLVFELPSAYANFSSALDFPILPAHILKDVSPSKLLESAFSSSPVTSGSFTYNATQTVGTSGEKIVYLTANNNYYDGRPMLDSFVVHAYLTADDIVAAVNSNAVTGTAELAAVDSTKITNQNFIQRETSINSGVFAFLNMNGGTFSNKSLRNALQQGIDFRSLRAPLADELSLDYPLLTSQIDLSEKEYPALPEYDPDTAKETIVKSTNSKEIVLATVSTGYLPDLAENLKYQLENLGFTVDLQIHTAGQDFLVNVVRQRSYDILIYEIELGADPDLFAYYHSTQATSSGLNLSNYKNTFASDAILAARSTMNVQLRNVKYQNFLKYWVSDAPALGIYQTNMTYYVNKNMRVFSTDSRLVSNTDRFADITNWAVNQSTKNRTP